MSQKHAIDAEKAHEVMAASGGDALKYLFLALKYVGVLAGMIQGIATGNLDQHINGLRVDGEIYDAEVIVKKRQAVGTPAQP